MDILVICTGCNAKFKVSEKFAGKRGPCPKCKTILTIPNPDIVKIAEPEEYASGGKTVKGQLITKPIAYKSAKITPVSIAIVIGSTILVLVATYFGGPWIRDLVGVRAIGLIAVTFPLVFGAYTFLRNDELEPYRGQVLLLRCGICAAIYAVTWGVFAVLPDSAAPTEIWMWLLIAPPFLAAGTIAAVSSLDLEWGNAFFHYCFYLIATLILRFAAGMPPLWGSTVEPASRTLGL